MGAADQRDVLLSVVVRTVGGAAYMRRFLSHMKPQIADHPVEIIVPYEVPSSDIIGLADEFPQVQFVCVGLLRTDARRGTRVAAHEIWDGLTARGLHLARGRIVAITEDYGVPDPDWCQQVLEAHRLPYAVIGGAVEHAGTGLLNWAVYFIDFGRYQLPLPEGSAATLTDVNVSYKRAALDRVREAWADRYNEATVHSALAEKGLELWCEPRMVIRQDRGTLSFPGQLAERFAWARVYGAARAHQLSGFGLLCYAAASPALPAVLIARMARKVFTGRRNRARFLLAFPEIVVLTSFWCLGEFAAYATSLLKFGSALAGRKADQRRPHSPRL